VNNLDGRIIRSRERIVLDHPWWSHLLLKLDFKANENIKTAATDTRTIFFNPGFFESLTNDDLDFVLCHEALHCGFLHGFYNEKIVNAKKFNAACDYAINPILVETGMRTSLDILISAKFTGLSAEDIYSQLKDEYISEDSLIGNILLSKGITKEESMEWQQAMASAMHTAIQYGVISENSKRKIVDTLSPPMDWKKILSSQICDKFGRDDYTWSKPSRRSIALGYYLPSTHGITVDKIAIAIDTSGSMSEENISQAVGLVRDMINQVAPQEILIIEADCEVCQTTILQQHQDFSPPALNGGGGTNFIPAIELAEKKGITTLVYITDLCGEFPNKTSLDIIFLTESKNVSPIGRTIHINK
jgi:predicted metal-dependent peptidase